MDRHRGGHRGPGIVLDCAGDPGSGGSGRGLLPRPAIHGQGNATGHRGSGCSSAPARGSASPPTRITSAPTSHDSWGFRGLARSTGIGATVGIVGGYLVGYYLEPSPRSTLLTGTGMLLGTAIGATYGYGVSPAHESSKRVNEWPALGGLIGFNVAVAGTAALSTVWVPSYEQLAWMWGGAGIGAAVSLPVFLLYAGGSAPAQRGFVFMGTTTLLGAVAGALFAPGSGPVQIGDREASDSDPPSLVGLSYVVPRDDPRRIWRPGRWRAVLSRHLVGSALCHGDHPLLPIRGNAGPLPRAQAGDDPRPRARQRRPLAGPDRGRPPRPDRVRRSRLPARGGGPDRRDPDQRQEEAARPSGQRRPDRARSRAARVQHVRRRPRPGAEPARQRAHRHGLGAPAAPLQRAADDQRVRSTSSWRRCSTTSSSSPAPIAGWCSWSIRAKGEGRACPGCASPATCRRKLIARSVGADLRQHRAPGHRDTGRPSSCPTRWPTRSSARARASSP